MTYKTNTIITKAKNEILDLLQDAKEAKDQDAILMLKGLIDSIEQDYTFCADCRDCFPFEKGGPELCPECSEKAERQEKDMVETYRDVNNYLNSLGWMK